MEVATRPRASSRPAPEAHLHELLPHELVAFAHPSERQLAALLDFYGIVWDYEPTQFVLDRDGDGRVTRAFTPDFYLPAFDLYLELTTLQQRLVTRKNRKAREVMARYPGTRVKILYQRDYLHLVRKHGTVGA